MKWNEFLKFGIYENSINFFNVIKSDLYEMFIKSLTTIVVSFCFFIYNKFSINFLDEMLTQQYGYLFYLIYIYMILGFILAITNTLGKTWKIVIVTIASSGYNLISVLFGLAIYVIMNSSNTASSVISGFGTLLYLWVFMLVIALLITHSLKKK